MKFKVGDVVKCTDNSTASYLTQNKTYKVLRLGEDCGGGYSLVIIMDDQPKERNYRASRFELVSQISFSRTKLLL